MSERRRVFSWALYDWANSAFATTVVAGLFPVFFRDYWCAGAGDAAITFRLGAANTISSLAVALLAPLVGAVADRGGTRRGFLLFFAALGVVMTLGLSLAARGDWALAAALYVLAGIGWSAGNTVYDSLLIGVTRPEGFDRVSALGYGLGYLGGGLLFAGNVLMVTKPAWFGLPDVAAAVRLSFASVAVWWAVFSIPVFLFVPEPPAAGTERGLAALRAGLRRLRDTVREVRRLRTAALFLLAYWLYIDGVHTIIRMAVDHGRSLGFARDHLILALLLVQFVGFPAALAFGWLGGRIGARRGIYLGLGVYVGACVWGALMTRTWEFYVLAGAVGLVQGGVQALSRSLYARMVPPRRAAEFFGFYNMVGKYAAVVGPLLMGTVKLATGDARIGIVSVVVLFLAGAAVLSRVDLD